MWGDERETMQTFPVGSVSPLPQDLSRRISSEFPPIWPPKELGPLASLSRPGFSAKKAISKTEGCHFARTHLVLFDERTDTAQT